MTQVRTRSLTWLGVALIAVFLVLFSVGAIPRIHSHRALASAAENVKTAAPRVFVIKAKAAVDADLSLAATTQAFQDAVVYARTSGYVVRRNADIGDSVKRGQVLAEIASPEIDQQLKQAQAELRQAQKALELQNTTFNLAQVTQERYRAADTGRAVAKQAVDQSVAAVKTAEASVAAAQANVESQLANVQRLQELTAFEKVVAPFDGTVIRRNVDVGALITAGSPSSTALGAGGANGLFEVAQIDVLRVFVNVPQVHAPSVKIGLPVKVTARGHLEAPVAGTVTRTASALDPSTRTLLVEIDLDNASHALMPGMFAYVGLTVSPSGQRWNVPATAVVVDSAGTRIVTIGADKKLHFQPVVLGRDFGDTIDIQGGLHGNESIVQQPRISLEEGQVVEPVTAPTAKG
jgi:RND family efflux transporter MFP subunit